MQVPRQAVTNLIDNIKNLDNPKESRELLRRWDEDREKYKKDKLSELTVNIRADFEFAENHIELLKDVITDERINEEIREEYYYKYFINEGVGERL